MSSRLAEYHLDTSAFVGEGIGAEDNGNLQPIEGALRA